MRKNIGSSTVSLRDGLSFIIIGLGVFKLCICNVELDMLFESDDIIKYVLTERSVRWSTILNVLLYSQLKQGIHFDNNMYFRNTFESYF